MRSNSLSSSPYTDSLKGRPQLVASRRTNNPPSPTLSIPLFLLTPPTNLAYPYPYPSASISENPQPLFAHPPLCVYPPFPIPVRYTYTLPSRSSTRLLDSHVIYHHFCYASLSCLVGASRLLGAGEEGDGGGRMEKKNRKKKEE